MPNGRKPGEAAPRGFTSTGKPRTTRAERQAAKEQKRLDDAATEERVRGEAAEAAAGMRTPTVVANMEVKNVIHLPSKVQLAIECWLDLPARDHTKTVTKVAEMVGLDAEILRGYWRKPSVREIIDAKLEQIEQAKAEIRARARGLTEDLLDSHTVALLDSKETPAAVKATLLGTAYKRFGMLKEKVENTGANGAPMAFQLIRLSGKKESDGADPDPSL
jgi:hypothetical protein